MASLLIVEFYLTGLNSCVIEIGLLSVILVGTGIVVTLGQLILLKGADVLSIAQKPSFAGDRLSVAYLLWAHVFEHFLDFVFIGLMTGGTYAVVRFMAL